MVEPVVTTGAALVGAAAWFTNKLFGPSVAAMGDAIRNYGTARIEKILGSAADKTDPDEVRALPPGFGMVFFQKASFSEDNDDLTEMWANLLSTAATNFTNRHVAYVEILSQLTAFDAKVLAELVPEDQFYDPAMSAPVNLRVELRLRITNGMRNISESEQEAQEELQRLLKADLGWPGRITSARIHYRIDKKEFPVSGGVPDQFAAFDNLERLGLLEKFDITNSMKPYETAVEGVLVTMLGIGFIQTCRGALDGKRLDVPKGASENG
ncbi:MAG: Abi-alpha family protein [Pseudomonadota bacterium]